MIWGSIVMLLLVGVGAIWGEPIQRWVGSLGGASDEPTGSPQPHSPSGGTL